MFSFIRRKRPQIDMVMRQETHLLCYWIVTTGPGLQLHYSRGMEKRKEVGKMLAEKTKQDVKELTTILTKLDNTGRTIMLSNAMVLLARQEVSKKGLGTHGGYSERRF